jgi:hypothetical protein
LPAADATTTAPALPATTPAAATVCGRRRRYERNNQRERAQPGLHHSPSSHERTAPIKFRLWEPSFLAEKLASAAPYLVMIRRAAEELLADLRREFPDLAS